MLLGTFIIIIQNITFIKIGRLRWMGHDEGMKENEIANKISKQSLVGKRAKGSAKHRYVE